MGQRAAGIRMLGVRYTSPVAYGEIAGRWLLVLPPEGGARQVGQHLWKAMSEALPAGRRRLFDTAGYLKAFDQWLKDPAGDMSVDLMGQSLVVQALDFEATHVLVMALAPIPYFTANLLRRRGIKTLHWFVEDHRQARYWEKVLPAYSCWLAIQRGALEQACAAAGVRFGYLPTAAGTVPEGAPRPWAARRYDAAFVGIPSPYRVAALESLAAAGISLALAGTGWDGYSGPLRSSVITGAWVDADSAAALLAEARLGLHIPWEGSDPEGCHVSPRLYETLAAGCALLCQDSPLCREAMGEWAGYYSGPGFLATAARAALSRPLSPGEQERRRGWVASGHVYRNRFSELARMAA